jgi:amino acid adenylation domain-containing protein
MKSSSKIEDIYPLSPMQQGMLFHSLYAPESGVYFEQLSYALHGPLDVSALKQAWQHVIARHAILRTVFVWEGRDKPLQVVRKQTRLPWEDHDWREDSSAHETLLAAFLQADRDRGFELSKAPPIRLSLLRLAEEVHQFVWSFHHLLLDGWSTQLVFQEVFAYYNAICQGQALHLPPSPRYSTYIEWLQAQDLQAAEAFWRQHLAGITAPTPLGLDHAPASRATDEVSYADQQIALPTGVTAALQRIARQQRLTLNTIIQGAWALLLSRYSGSHDVVFGATVAGRPADLDGVEQMVGLFINTLPLRVTVPRTGRVADWLAQLQATQLEARQYEYSPLVQIQGWSEIPRGVPLFESILVFENHSVDRGAQQAGRNLEVQHTSFFERTNYPLTVAVVPGSELLLELAYAEQRFDSTTIKRMLGHLHTLLERISADPFQPLATLSLLTAAEEQELLRTRNSTALDYPQMECFHTLFTAQCRRTPDHVAVVYEDRQLTYAELDTHTSQLAHHLQRLGVGPDVLVALCLERSIDLLVGLLAILKAGGAYVPLDPSYPAARLAFVLEDAQPAVLLTQQRCLAKLPPHQIPVLCIDTEWTTIAQHPAASPVSAALPDHLAYVIYTSGSTGRPKGVQIHHRALVNFLYAMLQQPGLSQQDTLVSVTTVAFDIAALELLLPLLVGARVCLVSREVAADGDQLLDTLVSTGATILQATPATWRILLDSGLAGRDLGQLKLLCGGELLPRDLANQLQQCGSQLWNLYGPTETTIWSAAARIDVTDRAAPIGQPIANTQIYILDAMLQPVPVGVIGELYIGGVGVARGYLNRPELTAERFIPDPWSGPGELGARLYKTGDLARYLPNPAGNIEIVGRIDHQVKIRGYRIELGEIETALLQHPAVRQAVVLAREDTPGIKRLVAYLVTEQGVDWSVPELRSFLQQKLPEYMLPAAFVVLDALPLMPNGKVDRHALLPPDQASRDSEAVSVAPRTLIEEVLAGIWAEVLDRERINIHDNFFALGGHSLLAAQIISRVRQSYKVSLPVRSLFESPTLAEFAHRIAMALRTEQPLPDSPIVPVLRQGYVPLSSAQRRLWFFEQHVPGSAVYNIPAAVHLLGSLDVAALEQSLNEITRRHEVLRTTFAQGAPASDGQPFQVVATIEHRPLQVIDLRELPQAQRQAEASRLTAAAARQPFDLTQGPLIRTSLLRIAEAEHILLLTLHHIISDGWSATVFTRELAALYTAYSAGSSSPLPDLPVQYGDYAVWEQHRLRDNGLEAQLSYWRAQLSGAPPTLDLPTDRPRPAARTFNGATQSLALSPQLTEALRKLSRQESGTLFMTLFAAFNVLLYSYSGQDDIVVGMPIANRTRPEIEGLIGFFANVLALRTDLSGDPSFRELLGRVREAALAAYAHQDVPFEILVDRSRPASGLGRSPLFQVAFGLQHAVPLTFDLPGLALRFEELDSGTAKYELVLDMEDRGEYLVGYMQYNTDLFDQATIQRMLAYFQTLLEWIVTDPARPLSAMITAQPPAQLW